VTGIKNDEHSLAWLDEIVSLFDNRGIGGPAFEEGDQVGEFMPLDGRPIVWTDFDVDPYNAALRHCFADARVKDERPAMSNAGFNNHIRLHAVDNLLDANEVFRQLDHRTPEPAKGVGILLIPSDANPFTADDFKSSGGVERHLLHLARLLASQS